MYRKRDGFTALHRVEYQLYKAAERRCKRKSYRELGVKFLFNDFAEFFAALGSRPRPELTVDRTNNNGHYAPGNIRWATRVEQMNNTRRQK